MKECIRCKHKGELSHVCDECLDGEMFENKTMTNADRIRSMTDEELAEWIDEISFGNCFAKDGDCGKMQCNDCILKWLKSEVGCE